MITGGCGFIGTRLLEELLSDGHHVRVLDNLSIGTREDLGAACGYQEAETGIPEWGGLVGLVVGDIRDEVLAVQVCEGADVIVHLAAQSGVAPSVEDPRHDMTSNVVGTFNYLEAARQNDVPRFVYASSGAAVGEVEPPLHEKKLPRPISPYGASKLCTEAYACCYAATFGIQTVGLRFGNVYGPGSRHKGSVVAKFIRRAMAGDILEIYGDGSQTRDFIFVDDLLAAIRSSAERDGVGGEVFQIAASVETTVEEITEILLEVMAERGIAVPQVLHVGERLGDVQRNYSDTSKAGELLGWRAETPLRDGLKQTVDWFVSEYGLGG